MGAQDTRRNEVLVRASNDQIECRVSMRTSMSEDRFGRIVLMPMSSERKMQEGRSNAT
jgi:hypothetical protein